ncbi:MAG: TrbI/VirB10 family protein [Bdellovibrionia bacterium]
MSDESQVIITLKDGRLRPTSPSFLYRRDGAKEILNFRALKWVGISGFIFVSTLLLFKNPDSQQASLGRSSSIDDPGIVQQGPPIDVPQAQTSGDQKGRSIKSGAVIIFSGSQLLSRPMSEKIPPGSMARAILVTGASNGAVRAKLVESLKFNGEVYAEEGATLIGSGSSTEDRLLIRFDKLVSKTGSQREINAEACDVSDSMVGLKGSKIGGYALQLAGGIGLNFAAGVSEGLQDTEVKGGVAYKDSSLKNALLKGTTQASLEQSRQMMESMKNKTPIIQVPKSSEILILFQ